MRKYDLIAKELSTINKCKVNIIPYVMTWEGLVTKYHQKHVKNIGIQPKVEAYIQSIVLKKTLESVSFERRRSIEDDDLHEDVERMILKLSDDLNGQNINS